MSEKKIQVWLKKMHRYCFKRCANYNQCWSHEESAYYLETVLKICRIPSIKESVEKISSVNKA